MAENGTKREGHGEAGFPDIFAAFNFWAPPTQAAVDPNMTIDANPEFTPGLDIATASQPTFKQLDLFLNVYDNMREQARIQQEENETYGLNETDLIDQYHQFRASPRFKQYMDPIAQRLDRMDLVANLPQTFDGYDAEGIIQTVDEIYSQIEIEDRDQYLDIAGLADPTMTPTLSRDQINSFMTATADIADGEHTVTDNYDVTPATLLARQSALDIARQNAAAQGMDADTTDSYIAAFAAQRQEVITELENIDAPIIPSTAEIAAVEIYKDMDASTDLAIADAAGVKRDVYLASLGDDAVLPEETVDVAAELDATPVQAPILPEIVHAAQAESAAAEPAEPVEPVEPEAAVPAASTPPPASIIERTEPAVPAHSMVGVPQGGSLWQMVVDHYGMEDAKNSEIMKRIEEVAAIPENHAILQANAIRAGRPEEVSAHYIYEKNKDGSIQQFKFPTEETLAADPQIAPTLNWRKLDSEWNLGM